MAETEFVFTLHQYILFSDTYVASVHQCLSVSSFCHQVYLLSSFWQNEEKTEINLAQSWFPPCHDSTELLFNFNDDAWHFTAPESMSSLFYI